MGCGKTPRAAALSHVPGSLNRKKEPICTLGMNPPQNHHIWQGACLLPCTMTDLLKWTLVFFILALIAAALGFGGIAGTATSIAQILFFGFLVLAVVTLVMNLTRSRAK